jgi:hypothetical protein
VTGLCCDARPAITTPTVENADENRENRPYGADLDAYGLKITEISINDKIHYLFYYGFLLQRTAVKNEMQH